MGLSSISDNKLKLNRDVHIVRAGNFIVTGICGHFITQANNYLACFHDVAD